MELFEKTQSLEELMKRQEKSFHDDEIYSRLFFLPVTVIVVSLFILAYNFTAGKDLSVFEIATHDESGMVSSVVEEDMEDGSAKIDINIATVEELVALPGIGEVKARDIVELRTQMGGFMSIEDILNVEGIGEKTFESIRDSICVN